MKKKVLITGTGLISKHISSKLEKEGIEFSFLSRTKTSDNHYVWDIENSFIEEDAFHGITDIIHLAGANIADKRWTKKVKKELISSRINSTKLLIKHIKSNNIKINTFITASAIGYYGTKTTENIYTEKDPKGDDFLSELCYKWEKEADNISDYSRVIKVRIAVVLSQKGGALTKMKRPIKAYIGTTIASGKQYIPWIHIDDLSDIFLYLIKNNKTKGVYNAVAPEHINNYQLTKEIARELKKPILLPNIPGFVFKLIFGEMSIILLKGSRVSCEKIIKEGYTFKYKSISSALKNLLKKP